MIMLRNPLGPNNQTRDLSQTPIFPISFHACRPSRLSQSPTPPAPSRQIQSIRNPMASPHDIEIHNVMGAGSMSRTTFLEATSIPDEVNALFPPGCLSIPLFVKWSVPTELSKESLSEESAGPCLIDAETCWSLDTLQDLPTPPGKWLRALDAALRSRWQREQITAVQHPTFPEARLPLWAIEYWQALRTVGREIQKWRSAIRWLLRRPKSLDCEKVVRALNMAPWSMNVWSLPAADSAVKIGALWTFLSHRSLNETHIHAFAAIANGRTPVVFVTNVAFTMKLQNAEMLNAEQLRADEDLAAVVTTVTSRRSNIILIPANMGDVHWVLFRVDIASKHIACGMLHFFPDLFV